MTTPPAAMRRTAILLAAVLFASYAYFYEAGGWNQNSRFALVRAILEEHTLQIDSYKDHTGDRALWNGHYYSDKAPGTSLLAVPTVAIARLGARMVGVPPESMPGVIWTSYIATIATAGLCTVAAALAVFWLSIGWGASRRAAVFAASAYGLATPAWCYAVVFVGHNVTAGCLMLAFMAATWLPAAERHRTSLAWTIGVLCGIAVLSEFPAAVPVSLIVLLTAAGLFARSRQSAWPLLARVVAGGAVVAMVLLAYNAAAFDSPFRLGYGSEDNSEGTAMLERGLFGITRPTFHVAYEVLLGEYRGLLPIAPLCAVAPIGLFLLGRDKARRRAVLAAAAIALAYVLLNLSYHFWEGGWFFGPRHLVPGLPFLALGLAPLWDRWRTIGRVFLIAGWLWGAGITLVAVSTTPQPPSDVMAPVAELLWPAFAEGDLSLNDQSFVDFASDGARLRHQPEQHDAWNVGELIGLRGLLSLAPLIALWLIAARWLW